MASLLFREEGSASRKPTSEDRKTSSVKKLSRVDIEHCPGGVDWLKRSNKGTMNKTLAGLYFAAKKSGQSG